MEGDVKKPPHFHALSSLLPPPSDLSDYKCEDFLSLQAITRDGERERAKMENAAALEITIISAEDLRLSHRPLKKNAFVTVRSSSFNDGGASSTSLDRDGGSYPHWNEKLKMALPASAHSISVEVRCKTGTGERLVAVATVPVSDFCEPAGYLHFLSYRLRERDGERNGIINLSVRMEGAGPFGRRVQRPVAAPPTMWVRGEERRNRGVAVGYPVGYGY